MRRTVKTRFLLANTPEVHVRAGLISRLGHRFVDVCLRGLPRDRNMDSYELRKIAMKHLTCSLVMLLCATATFAADDSADALAKSVLEKAGIRVGVCEMPRVGDGTLAAALARQGVAQVHGLAPDAKTAEAARKPSADSGVLGSQVIIETGRSAALPLGEWVADLYLVTDATDANLKTLPAPEMARVLSPYRGTAVVGNSGGSKRGLSKEALSEWAKGAGGIATIREDVTGLWAVVKMPPLAGGDDWNHHLHGADGNLVSLDTAFSGLPLELQWTNKPYYGGHWDIHVVSAGRMFTAQSSVFQHPSGLPYELVARSAYNGQVLWRRPIANDFGESASLVVATPDRLFLKDGGGVLVLDPETGAEIRRIAATSSASQRCLWLLVSDRILLTLTGPAQKYGPDADDYRPNDAKLGAQGEVNELYVGQELAAWDAEGGAELWRLVEPKIDPAKLVAAGGRVYLYANRSYAACLELKSGKQIWKTVAPITEPQGPGMGWIDGHATVKNMSIHRQGAVVTKEVYFINYLPHRQCQAFAVADGRLLWDKMHGPTKDFQRTIEALRDLSGYQVVMGSRIILRGGRSHDLLTGDLLSPGSAFHYGGCGRFSAVAGGLLLGQMGEIYDLKSKVPILQYNAKSSCGTGQFVADGLLFKVGANCPGCSEWRGFFASRSASQRAIRSGLRLEAGTVSPGKEIASDSSDWTTYRSDVTRKGSSAAVVPSDGVIRWIYAPVRPEGSVLGAGGEYLEGDLNAAQAVAVGDRIWIGTAEGAVVCVDRKTGTAAWRYWTAGRIMGLTDLVARAALRRLLRRLGLLPRCGHWYAGVALPSGARRATGDDLGSIEQCLADHGQRPGRGRHALRRRRLGRPTGRSRALRAGCEDGRAALGEAVWPQGYTSRIRK